MDARALSSPPRLSGLRDRLASESARRRLLLAGLATLLGCASLAALAWGAADLPVRRVVAILAHALGWPLATVPDAWEQTIVLHLRLPRLLLGILVGAALATSGAMMQGIFRNPLADPSLVGVSSGAALGAASMIVLGNRIYSELGAISSSVLVPAAAFAGGLIATLFVHRLSIRNGRTGVLTMLLAGIAINALASAGTGLWTYVADDRELRDLAFWTLGSVAGAEWRQVAVLFPFVLVGVVFAVRTASALDALLLGESEARHVGIDAERLRRRAVAVTAAMVGCAVAMSGLIFFVGLVVPHMIRLAVGPGHRFLIPASALLGGALLVAADLVARLVVSPAELPIGIVTALVGAPFFLALVRKGTA